MKGSSGEDSGGIYFLKSSLLRSPENLDRYVRLKGHHDVNGWVTPGALSVIVTLASLQQRLGITGNVCEIGVHHGRFMIALSLLRGPGEKSLALDVFEDQDLNVDQSGKGDASIFMTNVKNWLGDQPDMLIMKADSLTVSGADVKGRLGGPVRLFSVDGSHTCEHTLNDLVIAEESVCEGGIVIVDDFFNPDWPGVPEAVIRYLDRPAEKRRLVPIGYGDNKLYLTTPSHVSIYQAHIETILRPHLTHFKKVQLCGCALHRIATQPAEQMLDVIPVHLGQETPLNSQQKHAAFIGAWGASETSGTWATGEWSGIALKLPSELIGKKDLVQAVINLGCFRHEKNPVPELEALVFDGKAKSVVFPARTDRQQVTIDIDLRTLASDGRVELWFRNRNVASPAELGLSGDRRRLSFLALSLAVTKNSKAARKLSKSGGVG